MTPEFRSDPPHFSAPLLEDLVRSAPEALYGLERLTQLNSTCHPLLAPIITKIHEQVARFRDARSQSVDVISTLFAFTTEAIPLCDFVSKNCQSSELDNFLAGMQPTGTLAEEQMMLIVDLFSDMYSQLSSISTSNIASTAPASHERLNLQKIKSEVSFLSIHINSFARLWCLFKGELSEILVVLPLLVSKNSNQFHADDVRSRLVRLTEHGNNYLRKITLIEDSFSTLTPGKLGEIGDPIDRRTANVFYRLGTPPHLCADPSSPISDKPDRLCESPGDSGSLHTLPVNESIRDQSNGTLKPGSVLSSERCAKGTISWLSAGIWKGTTAAIAFCSAIVTKLLCPCL